jgi:hypothetical protein
MEGIPTHVLIGAQIDETTILSRQRKEWDVEVIDDFKEQLGALH